jgi:adenosylcobyric acid synthase
MRLIAERTGVPCLGPLPFFPGAAKLPAEDSLALDRARPQGGPFLIAIPRLPRIANFDDFDPLIAEPGVTVTFIEPGTPLPQQADLVILPGSKATRADLAALRATGWDVDIRAHRRAGKRILGVCGGYQMLGRTIADPDGIEGAPGTSQGLGLLAVDTVMGQMKQLRVERAVHADSSMSLKGYRMHMGLTSGSDCERPFSLIDGARDGARSQDGKVEGTYLHGIFQNDAFRHAFLNMESSLRLEEDVDGVLNGLADHVERHLDLEAVLALAGEVR